MAAFLKDAAEYGLQDIGGEPLNTMITDVVNSKMQARPNMTPQEQADEVLSTSPEQWRMEASGGRYVQAGAPPERHDDGRGQRSAAS